MTNGMATTAVPSTATARKKSPAKGSSRSVNKQKAPVSSRSVSPSPLPPGVGPVGRENLVNMFEVLRNNDQPMQTSEQGVPYKVLVGDLNEDPGYLRPPTQQDIDYGDRLERAQRLKASGKMPGGRDPVTTEQRITAAERQIPGWRDEGDSLRESIYGKGPIKGTLSNVGDMLTSAYKGTLGKMVPFAHLPGGAIHAAGWGAQPNQAEGWAEKRILAGEGTPFDQSKSWQRGLDLHKHKYYGGADPGPRSSNVYDKLGMPQPKPVTPAMDVGQGDVPMYLTSAGKGIDLDLGPAKIPPPGSDWGLPAGSLALQGMALDPYLSKETRDLIRSGFPVESLPPKVQEYIKNTMEKPKKYFDLSGGGGGDEEEEEGEGRGGIFNILKILLGLLGLGGLSGGEKKKKKKENNRRQPTKPKRIPWQTENRMNRQSYQQRTSKGV